jgi:hypothetical protein
LVFDVNDSSDDHSISLADFKRSLVHMDIHLSDLAATQVCVGSFWLIFFFCLFTLLLQEFAAIDIDRSAGISFSEYTNFVLKYKRSEMKGQK